MSEKKIICDLCKIEMILSKVDLLYQDQKMNADLLKCPKCGQVYISEELVKNKMREVESNLEEK